jgi:hypothetical protein
VVTVQMPFGVVANDTSQGGAFLRQAPAGRTVAGFSRVLNPAGSVKAMPMQPPSGHSACAPPHRHTASLPVESTHVLFASFQVQYVAG